MFDFYIKKFVMLLKYTYCINRNMVADEVEIGYRQYPLLITGPNEFITGE